MIIPDFGSLRPAALSVAVFLFLLLLIRTVFVIVQIRQARHQKKSRIKRLQLPLKTLVVLGSGGHTTEMLSLIKNLEVSTDCTTTSDNNTHKSRCYELSYIKAASDTTSLQRLETMMKKQQSAASASSQQQSRQDSPLTVYNIPRSREVGQSYFSSVFTTVYAQIHAMILLLFWIRPHLILTNGPGTCLPICLAGLLLRILGICPTQIVFCESYCRVETLSLTGILLYPIVDVFIVHWKELLQQYPLAQCVNSFVHS